MGHDIPFHAAQLIDRIRLAAVVRQGMPTTGGSGHLDSPVDPVHGKGDHPGGICAEGELRQLQEIFDFGGEFEFLVFTERVGDDRFFGVKPELLMFDFRFQLSNHISVVIQLGVEGVPCLERFEILIEASNHAHVVGELLLFGLQILLAKKFVENLCLIVHGRDGDPTGIPRTAPAAVIDAKSQGREARFTAHPLREDLIQGDTVNKSG